MKKKKSDKHTTNLSGKISVICFSSTSFPNLPIHVFEAINVNACPTDLSLVVERL